MKRLIALALLAGSLSFVGCGGVKELGPTDGANTDLEAVEKEKEDMMKQAMDKYKEMESPQGQAYSQ